jgi:hypothetical protein
MKLPNDCWNIIFHHCDINDTFVLTELNTYFYELISIYHKNYILCNAPTPYYKTDKKTIKIHIAMTKYEYLKTPIIHLSGDNIGIKLPNALFELKQLQLLQIISTKITKIPSNICNLEKLIHVDFCDNRISKISKKLFKLPKLHTLLLKNNPLILTSKLHYYLFINRYKHAQGNDINIHNDTIHPQQELSHAYINYLMDGILLDLYSYR